jgi:putative flavoprotein involved in K+ transport
MGVQLLGRLAGVQGHRASFAGDLADSVAFGDARYRELRKLLCDQLPTKKITPPQLPDPPPFHANPPAELDLNDLGVVIFSSGYRPDDSHWIQYPAVDALGFPHTNNGASTIVPGLHFCGVHFLHNHKSSTLFGVSEDATIIAQSPTHHHTTHRAAKRLSQQERPGCKR